VEKTLSIAQVREQMAQLPEQFAAEQDLHAITVTRQGQPVLAVLPWDLYESIAETLAVLGDAELMASIRASEEEIARGELHDWEDVKAQLGL
jgi:antitoxin YefM